MILIYLWLLVILIDVVNAEWFQGAEERRPKCHYNPCVNGGTCTAHADHYRCSCKPGWIGNNCEKHSACSPNPCVHGTCSATSDGYICTCKPGYKGELCDAVHRCYPNPCQHKGVCTELNQVVHCDCPTGYKGRFCEMEAKCAPMNPCMNGGTCAELNDHYRCICSPLFSGVNCEIFRKPTVSPPTFAFKQNGPQPIPLPDDTELNMIPKGPGIPLDESNDLMEAIKVGMNPDKNKGDSADMLPSFLKIQPSIHKVIDSNTATENVPNPLMNDHLTDIFKDMVKEGQNADSSTSKSNNADNDNKIRVNTLDPGSIVKNLQNTGSSTSISNNNDNDNKIQINTLDPGKYVSKGVDGKLTAVPNILIEAVPADNFHLEADQVMKGESNKRKPNSTRASIKVDKSAGNVTISAIMKDRIRKKPTNTTGSKRSLYHFRFPNDSFSMYGDDLYSKYRFFNPTAENLPRQIVNLKQNGELYPSSTNRCIEAPNPVTNFRIKCFKEGFTPKNLREQLQSRSNVVFVKHELYNTHRIKNERTEEKFPLNSRINQTYTPVNALEMVKRNKAKNVPRLVNNNSFKKTKTIDYVNRSELSPILSKHNSRDTLAEFRNFKQENENIKNRRKVVNINQQNKIYEAAATHNLTFKASGCPPFCGKKCNIWCLNASCCTKYVAQRRMLKKGSRNQYADKDSLPVDNCWLCHFAAKCISSKCVCKHGYYGDGYECRTKNIKRELCSKCHMHADCIGGKCVCRRGFFGFGGTKCWPLPIPI